MITMIWEVYGVEGHRQRESFFPSFEIDLKKCGEYSRSIKIEVFNSDKTFTNLFSIVKITAESEEDCRAELLGQITDGIFENSRVGEIKEVKTLKTERKVK